MKLFKKSVAVIAIVGMCFMYAQDIAGDYRLNGTNVRYTSLYRGTTPAALYITDSYGMGVTLPALTFQTGSAMNQFVNGPYPKNMLNAIGVNLNMSMYSDGTGYIYEGSTYPTAIFDAENCSSAPGVLPASDLLGYTSNLDAELPVQTVSIIGQPSLSPYAGGTLGSISLQQADIFDFFPATPTYMDYTGSPAASPEEIAYPGPAAGYITKNHTAAFLPEFNNGEPFNPLLGIEVTGMQAPGDLYLEWHAIDGGIAQSGFGDDLLVDEDEDGSPLDRILGIPYVPVSYVNTECGGGAFDPFDFRTLDPAMPIIGGNATLISTVASGGVDLCYGSGGLDVLAGGVCMQAITTDENGNGASDMLDGCQALAAGGYPENVAANMAIEGTCNALGIFTEESCATVASSVEADVNAGAIAQCCGAAMGNADCAVDTDGGATDPYGDGCAEYVDFPSWCGNYDDDDFDSMNMCTACGGGAQDPATYGYCEATYGDSWNCDMMALISTPDASLGGLAPVCGGLISLATACLDETGYPMDCADGEVCECATGFGNCETFGDSYGAGWGADCLDGEGTGNNFYALNPAFASYGNYVTGNGVQMQGCLMAGYDMATCGTMYGANDGDHDFNGVDGRLVMNYSPQCFPELQVREVHVDFTELGAGECFEGPGSGSGDLNNSCADTWCDGCPDQFEACSADVADVVLMVQTILGNHSLEFQEICRADIDGNGIINVVDVVQTVQIILGLGLVIDASSSEIIKTAEGVQFTADGTVGAFQFTITHDEDFSIELTQDAMVAEYSTVDNKTTVVIVMPETEQLFTVYGQYEISEVLAANSNGLIESNIVTPEDFTLSNAYPNPFNPTTSLLLSLDQEGIVAVKVFNINGQLIDLLTEGSMDAGMHTITWDAQDFASGVYFIKAYIGSEVITQKVSLMK